MRESWAWARFGAWAVLASIIVGGMLLGSPSASADTWTETSQTDFLGGTLTDAVATPSGDVVLVGSVTPAATKQSMVLDVGASGYDSVRAYNPFVLRETDGTYKMWYTAMDSSRFRLAFADSTDGITWTKRGVVINVLTAPWDFDSVLSASVIKEGTTYHMWFAAGYWSGGPGGYYDEIYYATSSDGIAWSISGKVLALGTLGAWDDSMIATPWVVYDGSLYRLYYLGGDGATNRLGLATSATKTGFSRYGGNPILGVGPGGSWEDAHLGTPSVTIGTPWTMYYMGTDGTTGRIGLAFSPDGYTWTKYSGNPWMVPGPAAWDSYSLNGGAPVTVPGGDRFYYSGGDGTHWRVGVALLSPGTGFAQTGSYVSRVYDSGGRGTTWQTIAWSAATPAETAIAPSVRAGDTPAPDGSWTSWAAVTGPSGGTPLSLPRYRYVQYRMVLSTTNSSVTPTLHDVTITYGPNGAPAASAMSPSGGAWVRTQTPALQWTVSDPEGDPQSAFEVQVDTDPAFGNPFSSGVWTSSAPTWQPPALAEGLWNWRVRIADSFGLWGPWGTDSFGVDSVAPDTGAALAGTVGLDGWRTGPVTVNLTAYDATSGVAYTEYRIDGSAWAPYAAPFVVSGEGPHSVEFRSRDVAGNLETTHASSFKIDSQTPVSAISLAGTTGDNGWYTSPVTATLSAADATSGVSETRYRIDGGPWQTYSVPFVVSGDGTHLVEYLAVDNASLAEAARSASLKIDTTPPVTTATPSARMGDGGFYTAPVAVVLTALDATSGVAYTEFSLDAGAWQPYTGPILVAGDGSHTVAYRSTDAAGLMEAEGSVAFDIDTIPPATTVVLTGPPGVAGFYTGPVTVSLSATDATSGVSATQYRIDGGLWQTYTAPLTVGLDGLHVVEFRSTDHAGLEEPVQSVRFSVDTGILSPTGPFGPWLLVALIAITVAVASLLIAFALWRRKRKEPEPEPAPPPPSEPPAQPP